VNDLVSWTTASVAFAAAIAAGLVLIWIVEQWRRWQRK
jgi:hypothetical protein